MRSLLGTDQRRFGYGSDAVTTRCLKATRAVHRSRERRLLTLLAESADTGVIAARAVLYSANGSYEI